MNIYNLRFLKSETCLWHLKKSGSFFSCVFQIRFQEKYQLTQELQNCIASLTIQFSLASADRTDLNYMNF